MLFFKHALFLILVFLRTHIFAINFNRNVQYNSLFPSESLKNIKRNLHTRSLISQKTQAFILSNNFLNNLGCRLHSTRVFGTKEDIENEVQDLYAGLKDKKWSFTDLRRRLTDEGIPLDGCSKPDDVIRRVAQLSVLGKDELKRQLEDNGPEFLSEYNYTLDNFKSDYEKLSKKEKKLFVNNLLGRLEKYDVEVPKDYSDEDVMDLAARVQSKNKLQFKLPQRTDNFGAKTVEAYKAEADSIFSVYETIKEDEFLKKSFMDDVTNELVLANVDFNDCKTDEALINRLAYSRVFPKMEKGSSLPKKRTSRGRKFLNTNPLESFFSFQGGDFGNLGKLLSGQGENMFEDSFFGGFDLDTDSMFDGLNLDGFSIFKDLASMFGINPNQMSQQVEFESSEDDKDMQRSEVKFTRGDVNGILNEDTDNHIETDPSLILLQQKAKVTGDHKLQTILNKAIMDPTLRDVLKTAATKGYESARELCSGNVKALYILEKLNDKHIWS